MLGVLVAHPHSYRVASPLISSPPPACVLGELRGDEGFRFASGGSLVESSPEGQASAMRGVSAVLGGMVARL